MVTIHPGQGFFFCCTGEGILQKCTKNEWTHIEWTTKWNSAPAKKWFNPKMLPKFACLKVEPNLVTPLLLDVSWFISLPFFQNKQTKRVPCRLGSLPGVWKWWRWTSCKPTRFLQWSMGFGVRMVIGIQPTCSHHFSCTGWSVFPALWNEGI